MGRRLRTARAPPRRRSGAAAVALLGRCHGAARAPLGRAAQALLKRHGRCRSGPLLGRATRAHRSNALLDATGAPLGALLGPKADAAVRRACAGRVLQLADHLPPRGLPRLDLWLWKRLLIVRLPVLAGDVRHCLQANASGPRVGQGIVVGRLRRGMPQDRLRERRARASAAVVSMLAAGAAGALAAAGADCRPLVAAAAAWTRWAGMRSRLSTVGSSVGV